MRNLRESVESLTLTIQVRRSSGISTRWWGICQRTPTRETLNARLAAKLSGSCRLWASTRRYTATPGHTFVNFVRKLSTGTTKIILWYETFFLSFFLSFPLSIYLSIFLLSSLSLLFFFFFLLTNLVSRRNRGYNFYEGREKWWHEARARIISVLNHCGNCAIVRRERKGNFNERRSFYKLISSWSNAF